MCPPSPPLLPLMCPPPPPPPLPLLSYAINSMIKNIDVYNSYAARLLLLVLSLWHVGQAFFKRLWLLSSHHSGLLALNAGTLVLLSIMAKPAKPWDDQQSFESNDIEQRRMLFGTVFICTAVGALMPSAAASADLRDMWSNAIGVAVLIISTNFIIFLQFFYVPEDQPSNVPTIHGTLAMEQKLVMASLFLLLLVLLVQAVALEAMISDVKAIVLERLEQLCIEVKASYNANVLNLERPWSWEVVEHNTCVKLMMALTSNPQHMIARSPATAIVGALVLFCTIIVSHDTPDIFPVFSFICVWRWVRLALQEDRSFLDLVFNAEPSYWRRKVNNFRCTLKSGPRGQRPNVFEEGQYGFKEVLCYTAAFLMLCVVVPFHWLLVALIRFTHILSALLMQKLIWLPVRALRFLIKRLLGKRQVVDTIAEPFDPLGVVCLEGEDAHIVGQEFASAANFLIRRQLKRAKTKSDIKALVSLLHRSKNSSSVAGKGNGILDVLHQDGAPYVENLHVEHGYQYGWSLTVVSLLAIMTKVEVLALGTSEMSERAMDAYWQAMDMMQLVDEQFVPCTVCSKETYASASASEWSKLQKKKQRWPKKRVQLDVVDEVLKAILEPTERHMTEFNKTRCTKGGYIAAAWSQQTVISYTMHTVCQNMLRRWTDFETAAHASSTKGGVESNASEIIKALVEHMNVLIAEVVACCLSSLPTALEMSMTEAVLSGNVTKFEKGLFLVAQGKHLWAELRWPTLYSSSNSGRGHLRKWIHVSEISNAFTT